MIIMERELITLFVIIFPTILSAANYHYIPPHMMYPGRFSYLYYYTFPKNCPQSCETQGKEYLCGCDGQTYNSFDEINCYRNQFGRNVGVAHIGQCNRRDVYNARKFKKHGECSKNMSLFVKRRLKPVRGKDNSHYLCNSPIVNWIQTPNNYLSNFNLPNIPKFNPNINFDLSDIS